MSQQRPSAANETGRHGERPTLLLTDDDIATLADWPNAIDALRRAYARPGAPGATPHRSVATTSRGWLRVMPSAPVGGRLAGSKTIMAATNSGHVSYLITLFDQETSNLVALVDGHRITAIRTAATAAVAVDALAPARPLVMAVIGSGQQARALLRAVAHVRTPSEVRVFSPQSAHRASFADAITDDIGVPIRPVSRAEDAARDADLIMCATRSRDDNPSLHGAWVSPDATIVSVGSTTPRQRELAPDLIQSASMIVADSLGDILKDSGDLIAATQAGIDPEPLTVSLSALLAGPADVNRGDGRLIYLSAGSGFQDVVLAEHLYDRARERGLGTPLPGEAPSSRTPPQGDCNFPGQPPSGSSSPTVP